MYLTYLLLCAAVLTQVTFCKTTRFEFRDAVGRDLVSFISEAPLDRVLGTTNHFMGWLEVDPEHVETGIKGEFEVDVRGFDTGIDLRNEHFRNAYLSTSEHPSASFTITKASATKLAIPEETPTKVEVHGDLKIRGIVKNQKISLRLTHFKPSERTKQRLPGNLLRISAAFDVETHHFGIVIPDNLKLLLNKVVKVTVDAVGTDSLPQAIPPASPNPKDKSNEKPTL